VLPEDNQLRSSEDVDCNDTFAVSIEEGKFFLVRASWNKLLFSLWSGPCERCNRTYYDDIHAIEPKELNLRSNTNVPVGDRFSCYIGPFVVVTHRTIMLQKLPLQLSTMAI